MAKSKEQKQEDRRIRRIIMIIIAIIIILLLLRSCSSEFNWTIGRLFGTSSKHEITDTDNDKPIILNQNLKFDVEEENITVTDDEYKIGFSFENINPEEFTCTTSDASLATCYVKDGYVVVPVDLKENKNTNKILEETKKLLMILIINVFKKE